MEEKIENRTFYRSGKKFTRVETSISHADDRFGRFRRRFATKNNSKTWETIAALRPQASDSRG